MAARPVWAAWVVAALIVMLALPPRLVDTDRFVTSDELFWIGRSGNFGRAVATGEPERTFQSGHPGVVTMWTAVLGMGPGLVRELPASRREVSRREVSQSPAFLPSLASARRAFGVATAVGVGLIALLAWHLLGPGPALLGGCLLALDPFLLAHSRLVHIDASLTIWMSVAVLAAVMRWSGGGVATLIVAGIATGLALLSKAPAAYVVGFVPLALVALRGIGALRDWRTWRDLAGWGGLAALTYLALWPAMLAAPGETLGQVFGFIRDNSNSARSAAAQGGGGVLYYPLVFLLRSTPLSLLGLALLVPARRSPRLTRTAIVLAAYPLGFGLIMTVAAKNIDRYLLPSFPILDVLAGLGFWLALTRLAPRHRQWGLTILAASIVGLSAWWVAGAWPYVLTYANPLVGGPSVATPRIASGWGEGLDQVAAYLNRRPNAERLKIGMPGESYTTVLGAQVRGQVVPADGSDAGRFDYVVVYLRNLEIDQRPPFFDERYLRWTPEAIISVGGIDYAWIYRSAVGAPVGAIFGDLVELEGYGLESVTGRLGRSLGVHLRWRPRRPIPPNLQVLVELRPSAGGPAHSYTFPLKPVDSAGWPTNELASASYPVMVDRLASPGAYVLAVRVLDGQGHPLALTRGSSLGPEATPEPDAIALRGIEIR